MAEGSQVKLLWIPVHWHKLRGLMCFSQNIKVTVNTSPKTIEN